MIVKKVKPKLQLHIADSALIVRLLVGIVCFVITLFIVMNEAAPVKYDLKVDGISDANILAPRDIVDKLNTEKLQQEAADKVAPQYDFDQSVTNDMQQKIYSFLSVVQKVRQLQDKNTQEKIKELRELSHHDINLSDENMEACIRMSENEFSKLQITILDVHRQIMDKGVETGELEKAKNDMQQLVEKGDMRPELKQLSFDILSEVIKPNKTFNKQSTQRAIEAARDSVSPIIYKKGEKIIGQAERVKPEHIEMLKELGLIKDSDQKFDYRFVTGVFLIVIFLFLIMIGYLYFLNRKIFTNRSELILLGLIFITALSFAALLKLIAFQFIYLIPLLTAAMLIAILLDEKLAIFMNFVLGILVALITNGDANFIFIALLGGSFAVLTVNKTYQRSRLVLAGVAISVLNALLIISFGLLSKDELKHVFSEGFIGILYSLLAIFLTIGVLPFLEATFNIVTPLKLLELSNPNQPLIKRLLLEAPGTYHHSLMVGNLAEAATEAIGGNALLARVAAYYHDIGKLKRPYFFKENQYDDNPHDRMTPNLSTLVITSHTKDGEEMAKANKIPLIIRDIIRQHHGTTLVAYFYHKAKNGEKAELVNAEDFRYEGPKPQTKEAAVVMLADSVEAAVRSMHERTAGKIEGMVRKIIKDKLDDGQLDMCDLTLKDLDKIAKAFLRVLSGVFHERIEYPEFKVKENTIVVEATKNQRESAKLEEGRTSS